MPFCLFLTGACAVAPPLDVSALLSEARRVDGLRRLVAHVPAMTPVDPRIEPDPNAPSCILQWYFDALADLEGALGPEGAIHRALQAAAIEKLDRHSLAQQTMAVRTFVPPQHMPLNDDMERCSYMVAYEGPADDFEAWLTHYLTHHPPLMLQLPALRELEIYTPVESRSALPLACAAFMQRNKVVFDDAHALTEALASPVRDAMRRDFHALPPYGGATPHYPMRSIYGKFAAL